ncbi:MAG: protease inhibitor I42 family protein [Kosmotogaceae bacterium]
MRKILVLLLVFGTAVFAFSENIVLNDILNTVSLSHIPVVKLEENGSTGFTWHFEITNPEILKLKSKTQTETQKDEEIVGAPQIIKWSFEPLKEGETTIIFRNYRGWEGTSSTVDIRAYNVKIVKEAKDGKKEEQLLQSLTINAEVGDNLLVVLEENPSTGYTWEYEISNTGVVSLKNEKTLHKAERPGAPATKQWTFNALSEGCALIEFKLHRSWENTRPVEEHYYIVNVKSRAEKVSLPNIVGTWKRIKSEGFGYFAPVNGDKHMPMPEGFTFKLFVEEQNGRAFHGRKKVWNSSGDIVIDEYFSGLITDDGRDIYIVEHEDGIMIGTLLSNNNMELHYLESSDEPKTIYYFLTREE